MKEEEYTCDMCKETYDKARTDEEAKEEAEGMFGKHPDEWKGGMAIVCDDCYNKVHPLDFPDLLEETKKNI